MEITIIINRADTMDWLGGDKELAEKFAARIAELTGYTLNSASLVKWAATRSSQRSG